MANGALCAFELRKTLLQGICGAALASAMIMPAAAQDKPAPTTAPVDTEKTDPDDIIITGVRANLQSAQDRKRNADTVVDSITAKDIGSFPDKSVAEALARVPGITVGRFSGPGDTSHFSAEPSGVLIRGLPQVRSEFNGRDIFNANSSRGLNWADISPELLGGIDVYKNQTADLIEGGVAGTINLRTRLPFDQPGRLISLSLKNTYGDLARKSAPEASAIFADRWNTGIGEIGVMINGAYSHTYTGSQGVQFDRMAIFDGVFGPGKKYIPSGIYMRDNIYNRERYGISAALQWRSSDGSMELTGQYNRSQYKNSWKEHAIYSSAFSIYGQPSDYVVTDPTLVSPLQGTPAFKFDSDGDFLSGSWSTIRPYVGEGNDNLGLGVNSNGQAFFNRCYSWEGCTNGQRAPQLDTASNALTNKNLTQDFGLNFRWKLTDRLRLTVDGQYVDSKVNNYNASVTARTYTNTFVDLTGKYPQLTFSPTTADNINLSPGGLANANNYAYYSVTDHTEDSNGKEVALRADLEYDVDSSWLSAIKVGARYSDRDQTVRYGAYNWANITNSWTYTQAPYYNIDRPVYPAGNIEVYNFDPKFFAGNQINYGTFNFFDVNKLSTLAGLASGVGRPATGVGDYYPVCSNAGYRAGETIKGDFGCYLPSEILTISERTVASYAMIKFGGDGLHIGSVRISGNVGARAVWTRDATAGATTFPLPFTANALLCTRGTDISFTPPRPTATSGCAVTAREIAFGNGLRQSDTALADHFNFLPSFNVKFDLTSKLVSRFAYSRAMSRPDIGLLRNFLTINRLSPNLNDLSDPNVTRDANGVATGYKWQYTGQAGNPRLKSMTADQFDVTLEYYFGRGSSFTGTAFYKKYYDYIQNGLLTESITNNGVTENVRVIAPINGKGASIYGAEVAFQTFFDFLPKPLDGFGIQANFTYVQNNGIKTAGLISDEGGASHGGGLQFDSTAVKANALEGVSKYAFNVVGMYEKGSVSARVAYNWRSKYLVTAIDCCVGLPIWQESAGYLDASFRLRVTKRIEFVIEGTNLLGTDTILKQQVDSTGLLKDNAWLKQDRRYQIGARITL